MKNHSSRALPVLGLLLFLQACGSDTPSGPPVVATPVPTPAPTPTPFGVGLACGASRMPECGRDEGPPGVWGCCRKEGQTGQWDAELWDAINILQREQPDLFRGNNILDRVKFISEVARITEQKYGLCVIPGGPGDEVGVKVNNSYSEQYDIYESSGRIRYPGYAVTCRPARF